MRRTLQVAATALSLITAGLPSIAWAQSDMVDGQITKVDTSTGKITIRHGPIKKFDMDDGMTMVFRVQDAAMLKTVKVGDKIKFEADKINGQFTVIKMQKAR
jgi:Cu/Ag efflux protein CusF